MTPETPQGEAERAAPRPARAGAWRRVTLRDVLVLTVPLAALGLYFLGSAVLDYHRIRQYDDWWSRTAHVHRYGWYRLRSLFTLPEALRLELRLDPERPDPAAVRLQVDRSAYDRVQSGLPASADTWMDAWLVRGNEYQDVELRFRGDTSVHWTSAKKSLTVKTARDEFYKGHRRLILSVKDVLPQYLVNSLAADFDLMGPDTEVVPVYLNDTFHGLYRFVEDPDESFLRRHGHMPGNVFRGDTAERGEYFKGLPRELFLNPYIWDRTAFNDRPGAIGTAGLRAFVADLNGGAFEDHLRFLEWLDRDELERLLALLLVAGDPFHMSGVHNQLWYEEPASGTWHPIVWDVRLLDLGQPALRLNRFWRSVLRDPRLFAGALEQVAGWLQDDRLLELARARLARVEAKYADELAYERLRGGVISDVGDSRQVLAQLQANLALLREWTQDGRAAVSVVRCDPRAEDGPGGAFAIDVEVRGRAPLELTGFALRDAGTGPAGPAPALWADADGDGLLGAADRRVPLRAAWSGAALETLEPEPLVSAVDTDGLGLATAPLAYRFFLVGLPPGLAPADVQPELRLRTSDAAVRLELLPEGRPLAAPLAFHPWRYPLPEPETVVLAGEVHLSETLRVAAHQVLDVAPGTTLSLAPDVSIFSRGRVFARGTAEQPITVERADPALPWGAVALLGSGASGSRLDHVRFLGGGGAQLDRVEFKGMVDVHWARDVAFRGCEFAHNVRCDDAFNAVHAVVDLIGCHFHDTAADAADYDFSLGTVRDCLFERVGNDCLDLMSTSPRILSNTMRDAGDKGVSIGEGSHPLVFDNDIRGCNIGIEVKDYSQPVLLHDTVQGNALGLNEYLKNWRYGAGGWAKLLHCDVRGNGVDVQRDERSRLTSHGTRVGPLAADRPGRLSFPRDHTDWVLPWVGLQLDDERAGTVDAWRLVEPVTPLYSGSFTDDFASLSDGWVGSPELGRVQKRDHDLVARVHRVEGRLGLPVDWDLTDPGRDYVLVLELAGDNVPRAVARTWSGSRAAELEVVLPADPGRYVFARLALDPGVYTGLSLDAAAGAGTPDRPGATTGLLRLHSWRVFALPRAAEGS